MRSWGTPIVERCDKCNLYPRLRIIRFFKRMYHFCQLCWMDVAEKQPVFPKLGYKVPIHIRLFWKQPSFIWLQQEVCDLPLVIWQLILGYNEYHDGVWTLTTNEQVVALCCVVQHMTSSIEVLRIDASSNEMSFHEVMNPKNQNVTFSSDKEFPTKFSSWIRGVFPSFGEYLTLNQDERLATKRKRNNSPSLKKLTTCRDKVDTSKG